MMKGQRQSLLAVAAAILLAAGGTFAQQAPVGQKPAAPRPNDEGAAAKPSRLVAPFRGDAELHYTKPVTVQKGNMIVTTMRVMNAEKAPLAGFKVDEFWYDKAGNAVTGSPTFRWKAPLQPGQVIDVELKVPVNAAMNRNSYKFAHANGDVKPNRVAKLQ